MQKWSDTGNFGSHFSSILGRLFRAIGPLVPFGWVGFAKKEIWRGSQNGVENESEKELEMDAFLDPFWCLFRD